MMNHDALHELLSIAGATSPGIGALFVFLLTEVRRLRADVRKLSTSVDNFVSIAARTGERVALLEGMIMRRRARIEGET